jgi:hypothetical protein
VTAMHPLMALAAFSVATVVVYGVVYALLSATSDGTLDPDDSSIDDRRQRACC